MTLPPDAKPAEQRILGIDPGSRVTGWGVVARRGSRLEVVAHGVIRCGDGALPPRLAHLSGEIDRVVLRHAPNAAVLESPFHGRNSRSLIVLSQARGALVATLARASLEVAELTPASVKQALTGSGRADKTQVARMVRMVLGISAAVPMSTDTTDALAVAICYAQHLRLDRLTALQPGSQSKRRVERKSLKRKS